MIRIKSLVEKFFDAFTHYHKYYEIFVNPSTQEMNELSKQSQYEKGIRFLADKKTKKFYAWSADILHMDISGTIEFKSYEGDNLTGVAMSKGGKWFFAYSDYISATREKLPKKDWDWVNKYIDVSGWLT